MSKAGVVSLTLRSRKISVRETQLLIFVPELALAGRYRAVINGDDSCPPLPITCSPKHILDMQTDSLVRAQWISGRIMLSSLLRSF